MIHSAHFCLVAIVVDIYLQQRRLISIREAARGQGIPDHYQLIGDSVDIIRMIGNAVPVQLGEAFGRAFRDALIGQRIWDTHKKAWPREG
jgi:DNA (cytosine-5)-methyltransferase 1